MKYRYEWKPSPNFTPGSQTQAFYGRPRIIQFGAGHWWNLPELAGTHDGIVNTFLNRARQASAHDVVSDRRVTGMVRKQDTAWCTNNANPYTYAIECDPRIMWKWQGKTTAQKELGVRIFETIAQRIADIGLHNTPWKPHKTWFSTACNPIPWDQVMKRAQAIYKADHAPANPSKPVPAAVKLPKVLKFKAKLQPTNVWDLKSNPNYKAVTKLNKGDLFEAYAKIEFNGRTYYVTKYSFDKGLKNGANANDLERIVPTPEWLANLKDITDVKLMVLPAQTQIVDLLTGKAIKPLGQGTWVDIAKQTTVGGKVYLISSYSASQAMPNGILKADLGLPAPAPVPPVVDKPAWLLKWQDIEDVTMYTRVDAPLVNLLDGKTITTIKRGLKIDVASTTEWHGQKYAITKYSTDKMEPRGIMLSDLDMKPLEADPAPIPPAPNQPSLEDRVGVLETIIAVIRAALAKIGIKI